MSEQQAERIIQLLGIIALKVGTFGPTYEKQITSLIKEK